MPILNTDKILYGTDSKQLIHAYENLKANYSDELAKEYRNYYVGKPLSFIMKNARYIIPEPQFGLPFVKWVATSFPNPYNSLCDLKTCMSNYLDENRDRMHPAVAEMYSNACNEMDSITKCRSSEGAVEASYVGDNRNEELFDNIYSELARLRVSKNDCDAVKYFDGCMPYCSNVNFSEYMKKVPSVVKVIYMTPYAKELCLESDLCESYNDIYDVESGYEHKANNLVMCEMVQELSMSERFLESTHQFSNMSLRSITKGMINADIPNECFIAFKEASEDTINPVYNDSKSAVNAIMEESVFDDIYKEDRENARLSTMHIKHAVYESVRKYVHNMYVVMEESDMLPETYAYQVIRESMGISEPSTVLDALKIINEAVSEVEAGINSDSFFEVAGDGSANKVIQRNHKMYREIDNPKQKAKSAVKVSNSVKDDDELDDLDEEDEDTELPKSARVASDDLPDSANPNATKPVKPKQGVLTKVQNKAIDAHKKSRETGSKLRRVGTGVKNAGKAVLKVPAGTIESLKNAVKGFDTMDDNRRKEYMLQPGYRKKVFKNLRVAAMYGLAGYTKLALVPVVWFGRKLSKEKNKRIRNEFASELDTEIKVCDAKIEDAMAAGDQKQRYQLIRIRDELARQKERVSTNGKYI